MISRANQLSLLPAFAAICINLFFGGCASLRFADTVLIKIPRIDIVTKADANHWHFRHVLQAPSDEERRGQWYVSWNDINPVRRPFWTSQWQPLFSRASEISDAAHAAFGVYPTIMEPNKTFVAPVAKQAVGSHAPQYSRARTTGPQSLTYNKQASPSWPDGRRPDPDQPGKFIIDPLWYLSGRYSELGPALKRVGSPTIDRRIRIGHLDNGLDGRHSAVPEHLVRGDWQANAVGLLKYAQDQSGGGSKSMQRPVPPEETGGAHGLGTVGILAGGRVNLPEQIMHGGKIASYVGYLGGAPFCEVVPVRVAPWVFSIGTAELAYAIDYASRVKKCDVITMSHGGAFTMAWLDAVNAAYERGTALFAAEGDFLSLEAAAVNR
jgi:hypothetical protein